MLLAYSVAGDATMSSPIRVAQIDESPEREYHHEAMELATMLS
jgi:hypothetical protein